MQATHLNAQDQQNYEQLMVALEASQGKLDLLVAVCDDRNLEEQVIQQYAAELQQQGIAHYRVLVNRNDPSLRFALEQLLTAHPSLQAGSPAVVTVQGIGDLLSFKLDTPRSEQEYFLGYLQWTREAFRRFPFPVVVWVPFAMVARLTEQAPDFWSWRGGVFWFGQPQPPPPTPPLSSRTHLPQTTPLDPALAELLHRIDALEQQTPVDETELARLYEDLGKYYEDRQKDGQHRQFAIQAYKRAAQLQAKLHWKAELAESLERLGHLYFELKDDVTQAQQYYEQAIALYREVGARLGEANTLQAIGDVLQFLDRRSEALDHYQQAIALYREVGARLGEANVLQEFGKLQEDKQAGLDYLHQAQTIYEQIGDKYSQSRNLLFISQAQAQLETPAAAIESLRQAAAIAREIGVEPLEQYALAQIIALQNQASPSPENG